MGLSHVCGARASDNVMETGKRMTAFQKYKGIAVGSRKANVNPTIRVVRKTALLPSMVLVYFCLVNRACVL